MNHMIIFVFFWHKLKNLYMFVNPHLFLLLPLLYNLHALEPPWFCTIWTTALPKWKIYQEVILYITVTCSSKSQISPPILTTTAKYISKSLIDEIDIRTSFNCHTRALNLHFSWYCTATSSSLLYQPNLINGAPVSFL